MAVWPGTEREAEEWEEYRNSWGGAAFVWSKLFDRYIPKTHPYDGWLTGDNSRLWKLVNRKDIPEHQRALLMFTFDYCFVAKQNFARFAADIDKFIGDFPSSTEANHLPAWKLFFEKETADAEAIGLHATSVSDNLWYGEYDGDKEKSIDWEKAYELYEQLEVELELDEPESSANS